MGFNYAEPTEAATANSHTHKHVRTKSQLARNGHQTTRSIATRAKCVIHPASALDVLELVYWTLIQHRTLSPIKGLFRGLRMRLLIKHKRNAFSRQSAMCVFSIYAVWRNERNTIPQFDWSNQIIRALCCTYLCSLGAPRARKILKQLHNIQHRSEWYVANL